MTLMKNFIILTLLAFVLTHFELDAKIGQTDYTSNFKGEEALNDCRISITRQDSFIRAILYTGNNNYWVAESSFQHQDKTSVEVYKNISGQLSPQLEKLISLLEHHPKDYKQVFNSEMNDSQPIMVFYNDERFDCKMLYEFVRNASKTLGLKVTTEKDRVGEYLRISHEEIADVAPTADTTGSANKAPVTVNAPASVNAPAAANSRRLNKFR
jgi:hypothetical protein